MITISMNDDTLKRIRERVEIDRHTRDPVERHASQEQAPFDRHRLMEALDMALLEIERLKKEEDKLDRVNNIFIRLKRARAPVDPQVLVQRYKEATADLVPHVTGCRANNVDTSKKELTFFPCDKGCK